MAQRVDQLGVITWSGPTFRHTAKRRDPLSGVGARLAGGRWNPKGLFAALYLATPVRACMAELERAAASQGWTVPEMLAAGRTLHDINVTDARLVDLRPAENLAAVGLSPADVADDDWGPCQLVGHAAWFLGFDGIVAASATGQGDVVTAFEARLGPGMLSVTRSEDLDETLYRKYSAS
jgi:RES domain-containing protein